MTIQIAYDHQIFSLQPYGGISRYFVELASRVAGDPDFRVCVVAPMHLNQLLRKNNTVPVHGTYVPHVRGTRAVRFLSNSLASRVALFAAGADLIHETYYTYERIAPVRTPVVVTVFDMIHERFPSSFKARDSTRSRKYAAIRRASRIICISESTRRDLLEDVRVDPALVSVVPLAADPALALLASPTRPVAAPYVLYVGPRRGYKNFDACLTAFVASGFLESGMVLVCFGGGAWTAVDQQVVKKAGLPAAAVIHVGGGDDVLASLYHHAAVFIYPSLYEGFGIPPLEAMVCGCPVVCSRTSSLPEVVGVAAETFDPYDVNDMARALSRVVNSPEYAANLRRLGTERAAEFSWQRCAERTMDVYRSLL